LPERRPRGSVAPPKTATIALFADELQRGLEEVHVEPGRPIQLAKVPIGALALEPVVADELADDRAILLLDVALVVLVGGAATREGDPLLFAVR
jgi:hypothetical protein